MANAHRRKVLMSWSGGKDSAMALHRLQRDPRYEVVGLLTTMSRQFGRVSHHGVREELLDRQAEALGLPLQKLWFGSADGDPAQATMAEFHRRLADILAACRAAGTEHVAHGDIFLRSVRDYRDRRLAEVGMCGVYPLWGEDSTALLRAFTRDGFRAFVTCAEGPAERLAGVSLSSALLADWPAGVDPCGEHGEFHTFVHDGPIFSRPVAVTRGVTVRRDGRLYTDLLPADHESLPTSVSNHD